MSATAEMTCRELVELVTDYLDDALPPERRAPIEAHLALCDACATYLEQMRQTVVLLHAFRDRPPPHVAG